MARKKSKHSAPKEKRNKSILITLCILIIVSLICVAVGIGVIIITGTEKTLHAPQAPTPYVSSTHVAKTKSPTSSPEPTQTEAPKKDAPVFGKASSCEIRDGYETETSYITYSPKNVIDNNPSTAWTPAENIEEPWIKLTATSTQTIDGIEFENGYSKSEKLYQQNRRAKSIQIDCGGETYRHTLKDSGCGVVQKFQFPEPIEAREIKITILSYYEGTTYNDICITEITPY